ncbi:MAG: MFS transporter [Bacteroidales bacterium]|nr:MFS transporter [Bacteroidales bacterium]
MKITTAISRHNFYSLIWHASFLAFARNFIDVDTIIPSMLVDAGSKSVQIGIMTAIMLGGATFTQLIFAPFISNYSYKKPFLLMGINARILALLALGLMLFFSSSLKGSHVVWLIFILITLFSLGGAFANISYTDILGKSILQDSRKSFFSIKQVITGSILFVSALLAKKVLTLHSYPVNYAHMFLIGSGSLLLASLGFWNLKEKVHSRLSIRNPVHFFNLVKKELKENKRLLSYLGWINTQGVSIALLPFVILYAKEHFQTESTQTGTYLLFKVIGSVTTGLLLFILSGRFKYRYLLYINTFLAVTLPGMMLLFPHQPPFFLVFLTGGVVFALFGITLNGVLLEVSGTSNRALYTGIAGAGSIIPALFPLLGGWLIKQYGFQLFFFTFIAVVLSSLFFIQKLNCKK